MSQQEFKFTLWDVGHGLCIWIQTPNGHNHWIDCGATQDFSPAQHVNKKHGVTSLDYLIVSHPDTDHIKDLTNLVAVIGKPRTLRRNKSLPPEEKYKSGELGCQQTFKELDTTYTSPVGWPLDPENPAYNGGVEIKGSCNDYSDTIRGNDTSVVMLYHYAGWLFVCPGDIEDKGWQALWAQKKAEFEPLIAKSKWRVLVAPHHGRKTGYSQAMMDNTMPHFTIVSDVVGESETDDHFRKNPLGLKLVVRPNDKEELIKYLSTKQGGRVQFSISNTGSYTLHQYEYRE